MNLSLLFILSSLLFTSSSAQTISPSLPTSQTSTSTVSLPDVQTSTTTSSTNVVTQTSTSTTSTTSTAQTPSSTTTSTTREPTSTSLSTAPVQSTALSTSTSNGALVTVTVTSTGASSSSSSSPPPSATGSPQNNDSSPSLGIGPIIGMSVAGGIALIGIIAFVIWKMTKKRFSDFSDNEAIKWPELNSHGNPDPHPFPAHGASRAGLEGASELSLSRAESTNYSTTDFSAGSGPDPYAVPPLPHLNPNQPYLDDPGASPGYYDPYRGPVPGTLETNGMDFPGEVIPMTRVNATARTMSPGPAANFVNDGGRHSPAPHLVSHGRASPGPQVGYEGTGYGGR